MLKKADLPLESAILLIAGTILFPVSAGVLPFYCEGLYGLLLVMFALQTIALGKSPFGDIGRRMPVIVVGVVVAATGIVACFIPGLLGDLPRLLLILCFGPGGLLLLLRMLLSRDKFTAWLRYGGLFRLLAAACGTVYLLSMLIALLAWQGDRFPVIFTAVALLIFGAAVIFLALLLRRIYSLHPEGESRTIGSTELTIDQVMLLLTGVFMLLLGVLLIPVNLGLLPFSTSAQLGLLMVLFAIQMITTGSTPIGAFQHSWLMVFAGLLFAALGIVSCLVPGILVKLLTILVGLLNILGGLITLATTLAPHLKKPEGAAAPLPPLLKRLFATQLTMSLLTILFGTSMFITSLLPGLVIGVILAANGSVLLYLLHILVQLDRMQHNPAGN